MAADIELKFPAEMRYIYLATTLARNVCELIFDRTAQNDAFYDIPLCISEACANAIRHGARQDEGRVIVNFRMFEDKLIIRVRDRGRGFVLDSVPAPDFETLPVQGYGIYIIRSKMDKVDYERGSGENVLVMTKNIGKARLSEEKK